MTRRAILLFALAASAAVAQAPDLAGKFDERISAALAASGAPSVSIAVVQNGQITYAKAFGKADIANNRAADANTRYAVGSVSKQFTVAALLLLEEQGKLSLDDKVAKYFPDLTRAGEISIRQLLSHTAGYEDYAPQDYIIPEWTKPTTTQAIVDRWARKPLNFDPGTRWQYSNTGYVLVAAIFEKVSGRPLVEYLREQIFQPLGMTTAGDCTASSPADASPYTRFALGPPRPVPREANGWYLGAGELCMTPSDLARWDIAFIQQKILSKHSYEEFMREVKLADGKGSRYALGLQLGDTDGTPQFSHGGEVSGFLTVNRVYPTKGLAVIGCSNEDGISMVSPLSLEIARMLLGPAPAGVPEAEISQVRGILEGLARGQIDRGLFTSNANFYFSDVALRDYQASLAPLGKLQSLTRVNEQLRGGMTHRTYRAQFEKKTVSLNVYVTPDGKYEQLLVVEQF